MLIKRTMITENTCMFCGSFTTNSLVLCDEPPYGTLLYCNKPVCIENTKQWVDDLFVLGHKFILPVKFPIYVKIKRTNGDIESWKSLCGVMLNVGGEIKAAILCRSYNFNMMRAALLSDVYELNDNVTPELMNNVLFLSDNYKDAFKKS